MKKYGVLFAILAAVLVVVFSFVVSSNRGSDILKEFSYNEYKEEVKSGNLIVYLGKALDEDYDFLLDFAGKNGMESSFLDIDKLSDKQVQSFYETDTKEYENKLLFYEDGSMLYEIKGPFSDSYLQEVFMKYGFVASSYIEVDFEEYLNLIEGEGIRFMFIGSSSCGYCDMFKETIVSFYEEGYDAEIYYLDMSSLSEDDYTKLKETDSYFSEEEWGTPLNFVYQDGKRIAVLNGYNELDPFIKFMKENGVISNG